VSVVGPSRKILVEIVANGRYCDNSCPFMSSDAKRCRLFDVALIWNRKRKLNGNMRLSACRKSEVPQ
jgi:hypothetical protein